MMCALLRSQGRPARVRCGFSFYFDPAVNRGLDHWVTEVWDNTKGCWRLIDAEVDPDLSQHNLVVVDPLDIPRDQFQVAGTAWLLCRNGSADPNDYGVFEHGIEGEWFMAGNVLRDIAALNKIESCPFDWWAVGIDICKNMRVTNEQRQIIDELASLIADESFDFGAIRRANAEHPDARLSDPIKSWPKGVECDFTLGL